MSALEDLIREAEEEERKSLEAEGVADQLDAWRESMPNERIPEEAVLDTFIHLNDLESAAQEGRLSVVVGGEDVLAGTDTPAPGPDGQEGSPDEAGEGATDDAGGDTATPEIEGLWKPPAEAESDGYVEPSTTRMIASNEWLENAYQLWEFMGRPNTNKLVSDQDAMNIRPDTLPPTPAMSDRDIAIWAKKQMSMFNWNLMATIGYGQKIMNAEDPKLALAFLNLMNMYDHSDGGAAEFAGAVGGVATDPTTYVGAGVGSLAAKGVAKATAKKGLTKAIQGMLMGIASGAMEGSALTTGFNLVKQSVEVESGVKEEVDKGEALKAGLIGLGGGALLGGPVGYMSGRYIDKLMHGAEKQLSVDLFGAERKADDLVYEHPITDDVDEATSYSEALISDIEATAKDADVPVNIEYGSTGEADTTIVRFNSAEDAQKFQKARDPNYLDENVPMEESRGLQGAVNELDELKEGGILVRSEMHRGSTIRASDTGIVYELMGRTKNGWYRGLAKNGTERNFRRKQFDITEVAPKPHNAGPLSLDPFSKEAATLIKMAESLSGKKLKNQVIPIAKHRKEIEELKEMGVDILGKDEMSYWTPAELMWLRDTYNEQANGIAEIARKLQSKKDNLGGLTDADLAFFNAAHTQFMATRDLFSGVSGNAARQLNILKSRPRNGVYDFAESVQHSVSVGGGRVNTERAIFNIAEAIRIDGGKKGAATAAANAASSVWDSKVASALLTYRYNMMLSSWRTHFFNFLGNSASGIYHHLLVSPAGGAINNLGYAAKLAYSKIPGTKVNLDPGGRWTLDVWDKEIGAHFQSAMDSLVLAKEIALGRDIGEGKIWNELGLRYDVINVPDSWYGKLGTTPVRMLEAGDAFFKNQYYNSRMYQLAARKAKRAQIEDGLDFETGFQKALDDATPDMEKEAREFAAKMTYTNDPNTYQNIFGIMADGIQRIQSGDKSMISNMLIPFVRTPANLLSYAVEATGLNVLPEAGLHVLGFAESKTYRAIMGDDHLARQEALGRLTAAVGMWYTVYQLHQEGKITGTGPVAWEEVEAWKAAGWQPNSIMINDKWYDLSRAAPAGRALTLIASILDYNTISERAPDESRMDYLGGSLLYVADNIIDDSFMSTVTDMLTAVQAKQTGRSQSILASTVNSVLVPNVIRDIRRVTDPTMRTSTSKGLADQILKQMKNAWPGLSDGLAPSRDWKGDPKSYYGTAWFRALIPFNVRDPKDTDAASMAVAYARIAPSKPDKRIKLQGGRGNFLDLFAMDKGRGFVYDKYLQLVGQSRHEAVNIVMNTPQWRRWVAEDNIGPGSDGEEALRRAMSAGSTAGKQKMLRFLIDHSGTNNTFKRDNGETITIQHDFNVREYEQTLINLRKYNIPVPEDKPQYDLRKRKEGPEFFKP
jgi:hypothetical protein